VIDEMLHTVIPVLYAIYWLLFAPKEGLTYRAVPLWLSYPLVYCGYALLRGEVDGIYPYPVPRCGGGGHDLGRVQRPGLLPPSGSAG
jgi:hypothetical protein